MFLCIYFLGSQIIGHYQPLHHWGCNGGSYGIGLRLSGWPLYHLSLISFVESNIFYLKSICKVTKEMFSHWEFRLSAHFSYPEHISVSTCPIVFKFDTQHLGCLLVQYYDLFRCFDIHFVSGADLEKLLGVLQPYCPYIISMVPSYRISTWILTQHFGVIDNCNSTVSNLSPMD